MKKFTPSIVSRNCIIFSCTRAVPAQAYVLGVVAGELGSVRNYLSCSGDWIKQLCQGRSRGFKSRLPLQIVLFPAGFVLRDAPARNAVKVSSGAVPKW